MALKYLDDNLIIDGLLKLAKREGIPVVKVTVRLPNLDCIIPTNYSVYEFWLDDKFTLGQYYNDKDNRWYTNTRSMCKENKQLTEMMQKYFPDGKVDRTAISKIFGSGMSKNFSERLRIAFGVSNLSNEDIFSIFKNEVSRLISIMNKEFNVNITLSEIKFDLISFDSENKETLEFFSGFGISGDKNYKYLLGIHPTAVVSAWNNDNSRQHNIYESLVLFIKDCACHELIHMYDYILHGGELSDHDGWFIDHYAPEFAVRELHHDSNKVGSVNYRSEYTKDDPIFKIQQDDLGRIHKDLFSVVTTSAGTYLTQFCSKEKYLDVYKNFSNSIFKLV